MSSILDIARSGLLAYRNALAVTSENIANVGTDGYRRREVATVAAGGGQATATTLPVGGQGVSLAEVRRVFDALAAERARAAAGGLAAAEAHLAGATAIETLMVPGDDGIDGTLRAFFDALANLAGNPTDSVTRALALRAGEAVTGEVSGLAQSMAGLRGDLVAEAEDMAGQAQRLLTELARVSRAMGGLSAPGSPAVEATYPLADQRDALLGELAQLLPVSADLAEDGRPTVRLGSAAGPLLLQGDQVARLSVSAPDALTLRIVAPDGTVRDTRLLPSGRIGGLSRALGALDMAATELDAFARTLASALNQVHRGGVDLTGTAGTDLMRIDGWQATPAPANGGTVRITITAEATPAALPAALTLRFDGAANLWRAFDGSTEIAAGRDRLLIPGAVVDLAGTARDGDRIALTSVTGRAVDLRMAISDPMRLAAASAFATTAAPSNTGSGSLAAILIPASTPPIAALADLLTGGLAESAPGALGLIPAGTSGLTLVNLARPASTTLPAFPGAEQLQITLDGVAQTFDLAGFSTMPEIAAALSSGALQSQSGRSLSSLGLTAALDAEGNLVLTRPGTGPAPDAALTGPTGSVTGTPQPAEAAGGPLQILTRIGRHVAGTPLTAAEAASLLTPQNGFLEGAVYDPSPLIATGTTGYRGATVRQSGLAQSATLPAPAPAIGAALTTPPAQALTLADATGRAVAVALPEGASAALAAARLTDALPGIDARASTRLELSGFAPGPLRLTLTGANSSPVPVSAQLISADATPLAQAVNALTAATGIRAEISPDGARLLLVQEAGHDISLADLEAPAALRATSASMEGQPLGTPADWSPGQSLRQGGQVTLTGLQGFAVTEGAAAFGSAPVTATDVTLRPAMAGAAASLGFAPVPDAPGGALYTLRLNGQDHQAALPSGASGVTIAAALAQSLRAGAPSARLTGQQLATLPPEGSALVLQLDGTSYTLRMQGGQPVVTGPEAGRITATFDAANRLQITAKGMTDGTGIGHAPNPAFGLGAGQSVLTLTGQPTDPAALPATLTLRLSGQSHDLSLTPDGAVTLPAGFPGAASRDPATGALTLTLTAPAEGLEVAPLAAAGFGGPGTAVRVTAEGLELAGRAGPLDLAVRVQSSAAQTLTLGDLPPEDLIVAATGAGPVRLAGQVTTGAAPNSPGALTLRVEDAATGRVILRDSRTGDTVAEGTLDASGRATVGRLSLQLSGTPRDGDQFAILPAQAGSGNADTALALAALRSADPATGSPGLLDRLTRLQSDTGLRVAAANRAQAIAAAIAETSDREQAAIGAVDLDREAARLVELQQAYQASAQAVSVARDLFDTLLRLF